LELVSTHLPLNKKHINLLKNTLSALYVLFIK